MTVDATFAASTCVRVADTTTLEPVVVVIDPAYLILTPSGSTGMHVVWEDDSNNEDGFVLERSGDAGATWTTVVVTDPNVTSYDDTGLTGGTTYVYRVRAYSGSVLSDPTVASATTALMVLYASAAATAKFAVFDMIEWHLALVLCAVAFVVTCVSQLYVVKYVKKSGRQSIFILCIGGSILIGAVLMAYQAVKLTIDEAGQPYEADICVVKA